MGYPLFGAVLLAVVWAGGASLSGLDGVVAPQAERISRADLARIATMAGMAFPIIARPIGSHAGTGLEKLDDAAAEQAPEHY